MTEDKGTYLAFTADTPADTARAAYVKRYGAEPERVFVMFPTQMVCAGPVPQQGEDASGG